MGTLRDPSRPEDFADLDAAARVALAKQLDSMAEWNRAMSVFVANYQLDVLAAFRSSLVNRWHRVWALFAIEGCLSLVVMIVSLLLLGSLVVLVMTIS
jgi:hypothetical protein